MSRSKRIRRTETGDAGGGGASPNHLQIEMLSLDAILPAERRTRRHPRKQIDALVSLIREFGFISPVWVDARGRLIAGHARVEAARRLGYTDLPAIRLTNLSDARARILALADNRIGEMATWDALILKAELAEIEAFDLGVEIAEIGFDAPFLDLTLGDTPVRGKKGDPDPDDAVPGAPDRVVTRPGDLWAVGRHRLKCGDALAADDIADLMRGGRARMVLTDPPYGRSVKRELPRLGAVKHGEFAMASGEMDENALGRFFETALTRAVAACLDGALLYSFIDWKSLPLLLAAGDRLGLKQMNLIVWMKGVGGMGSFYRSQHELVVIWKTGSGPHVNHIGLKGRGGARTNVWTCPGMNAFGGDRQDALAVHPTVKPASLFADAIKDVTDRNELVLDPFAGTGTVLVSAQRAGRVGRAMEIEPRFCDVALRRYTDLFGDEPVLLETGETFEAVAERRTRECGAETADAARAASSQESTPGILEDEVGSARPIPAVLEPSDPLLDAAPANVAPVNANDPPRSQPSDDALRGGLPADLWAAGFRVPTAKVGVRDE